MTTVILLFTLGIVILILGAASPTASLFNAFFAPFRSIALGVIAFRSARSKRG